MWGNMCEKYADDESGGSSEYEAEGSINTTEGSTEGHLRLVYMNSTIPKIRIAPINER